MIKSTLTTKLNFDIEIVWQVVTNLKNFSWRSDLKNIEIINENEFIEISKNGFKTKFKTLKFEELKCLEFNLENDNLVGNWQGLFNFNMGVTTIKFTECVSLKKKMPEFLVKFFLKNQQKKYVTDLKKGCFKH